MLLLLTSYIFLFSTALPLVVNISRYIELRVNNDLYDEGEFKVFKIQL